VRATQDNLAIQPLRRADRALLTAPQLTGAGAQRRGARPRGALRARPDLHLALFRGASNQNRIYSVMALSNQSGQLAERYGYTPYGKRRVVSPGGATLAASAVGNQVGFTGRYHDAETGLTYFRARYLDTELGRFVGRDPIAFGDFGLRGRAKIHGGLYSYADNSPSTRVDPAGLKASCLADVEARCRAGCARACVPEACFQLCFSVAKSFCRISDCQQKAAQFYADCLGLGGVTPEDCAKAMASFYIRCLAGEGAN